jgi:hypothetical protein
MEGEGSPNLCTAFIYTCLPSACCPFDEAGLSSKETCILLLPRIHESCTLYQLSSSTSAIHLVIIYNEMLKGNYMAQVRSSSGAEHSYTTKHTSRRQAGVYIIYT